MKLIVAVVQYDVPEDTENSLRKLSEMAAKAAAEKAKLLVAPETAIGMLDEVKKNSTDYLPNLQQTAKKNHIAIATSFYIKANSHYFNKGYIVSSTGEVLHTHRKIYLAPPERENEGISAGQNITVSKTPMGKLCMLICKDGFNKFSHFLYEKLNELAADIICIPTWSLGWNELDTQEYIKALFVYGAFTSRSYVLVSGNLNKGTKSFGRSLIISPVKGVLKEGSNNTEEILIEQIDLNEVKKAREFDSWWQVKERIA